MDKDKLIVLPPSIWDVDNLGDLVAEGALHSDDLSLRAVAETQREEYLRLSKEWDKQMEEYLNSVDWEELKTQSQLATEEEEIF